MRTFSQHQRRQCSNMGAGRLDSHYCDLAFNVSLRMGGGLSVVIFAI